jgi:dienelactone hydrolase
MQILLTTIFVFSLMALTGCATVPTPSERQNAADAIASQQGWQSQIISTSTFDLVGYRPAKFESKQDVLTVYIEGDGFAWISSSQPSSNPTPINPIGLKLALKQSSGNAAYLARPCQYVTGTHAKNCARTYWTNKRFSEEVINSENLALDALKSEFGAKHIHLVGYSGGGGVATLLAERRRDVTKLITVAGNLDHEAWTKFLKISPLTGSLNPADNMEKLSHIEQIHFAGEKDKVILPILARNFVAKLPKNTPAKVVVVPNQTHSCCWDQIWPDLLSSAEDKSKTLDK